MVVRCCTFTSPFLIWCEPHTVLSVIFESRRAEVAADRVIERGLAVPGAPVEAGVEGTNHSPGVEEPDVRVKTVSVSTSLIHVL